MARSVCIARFTGSGAKLGMKPVAFGAPGVFEGSISPLKILAAFSRAAAILKASLGRSFNMALVAARDSLILSPDFLIA